MPPPEQTHRHAAIMFTDIVGYTALMGKDVAKLFNKIILLHIHKVKKDEVFIIYHL